MKQADLRGTFKKVTDCVCTSTDLIPPDSLSHTPLNSLKDTEEHPDDPNRAAGVIQTEYFSD
jgi:hypothetical protein